MMIALLLVVVCGSAKGTKKITVLHTSDTHSCILPLNKSLADTLLADRGGFLRRIAMLKQERQKEPNLLLFDCGDFSQGSSYYTMFKGDVEVELMNRMHYDAATIGNHEFDFGLDNMIRLFKMAEFPIVCSNYDFGDTELKDIVKPYIVLKRQGVKIGVFALCPPLEGLVSAKNYGPLKFLDPVEVTTRMVDVLRRQEKCDVVICLSHLGWEVSEYPDDKFISQTSGIDLVLGGHSHTYLKTLGYVTDKEGRQVPVDHEGKHAVFVGKMQLTLTRNKE
ncbi:bifunctional metallophosphatase/5'-nucleotidase [Prevotella sp. E15-22]|nr:bifunctional UDP-sugar hydrolase/5'-nucleotidase [Prevotella sp. E15-22]UPS45854.1 bifunctional metallophosphatase/5'-nucleotidase [Prevotella sp. E15-22]